jgi:hypothetical protein
MHDVSFVDGPYDGVRVVARFAAIPSHVAVITDPPGRRERWFLVLDDSDSTATEGAIYDMEDFTHERAVFKFARMAHDAAD